MKGLIKGCFQLSELYSERSLHCTHSLKVHRTSDAQILTDSATRLYNAQ